MPLPEPSPRPTGRWEPSTPQDKCILLLSILLQLTLGFFFGHFYDMRIFMATGYLVGTGQNPYIPQNITVVFNNSFFQGMTSIGYPPPWPLVLGLLYRSVYAFIPNLLVYNLSIKLPIIAANIVLAFLTAKLIMDLGGKQETARKAWVFLLLNPFLLYFATAWGQFDSIVALLSLIALTLLYKEKLGSSAILLALAFSLKPIALPLLPVALIYLLGKPLRQTIRYAVIFLLGVLLFCVAPFFVFGWSPAPILQGWNAHFTVGGGMSWMTFYELLRNTYQLPGQWWLLGLAWIPALGIGIYALKPGISGFKELLKKSTALILVFYLSRTWLSEPNIILILPLVLILTSIGELNGLALAAVWILPLVFTFFNASLPQLFFPSLPEVMANLLKLADEFRTARLLARLAVLIPWQIAGWWMVFKLWK